MSFLEYFFYKNLKHSFINKFKYSSLKNLPKIKKVTLTFKTKLPNLKTIATSFLALEFIGKKQTKGFFITARQQNLVLKIKKGNPIGCKIFLSKIKMFKFIEQLIFNVLLLFKNKNNSVSNFYKSQLTNNSCTLAIQNTIVFPQLGKYYSIFNVINNLNLTINVATKDKKATTFIFKSFQIHLTSC
jgi:large subunit ribosomal protein L5